MQQPDRPGLPLDKRADRRTLVPANDQIPLPMPGLGAVLGLERPLADREHGLLEPGPALVLVLVRAPVVTSGAQRGAAVRSQRRRPQQRGSRLVDGLVDALVTQPHPRLRGEPQSQVAADLLRAPPLGQQPGDQLPLLAVCFDAPRVMAGPPRGRAAVGLERPVAARGGVAAQLTRDRQRCPAQPASDLPDAQARLAQISDLDPFVLRQEPRADLTHS